MKAPYNGPGYNEIVQALSFIDSALWQYRKKYDGGDEYLEVASANLYKFLKLVSQQENDNVG